MAFAAVMAMGGLWAVALIVAGDRLPLAAVAPALLPVGACALWVVLAAVSGSRRGMAVLLVLVAFGLSISFRVRDYGETGIDLQNGLKLLVWLLIPLIAIAQLPRMLPFLREPAILLAAGFATLSMASALWSQTPVYTAASALGLLSYLVLACLVTSIMSERMLTRVLLFSFFAFALLALAAALVVPERAWLVPTGYAGSERLQGLSGHPNVLGEQMAVMITLAVVARRQGMLDSATFLLCLVLGIIVLEATGSRTMLAAVALTWLVVWLRGRGMLALAGTGAAGVACILLVVVAMGSAPNAEALLAAISRSGSTWELLTLTGRTDLWQIALELVGQKPLLGWGYNGTEAIFVANVGRVFYGDPVNAHSMYLQTLVTLGLLGSLPLLALLVLVLKRVIARPDPAHDQIALLVVFIGLTEVAIAATPTALTLVFFIVLAREARQYLTPASAPMRTAKHESFTPQPAR